MVVVCREGGGRIREMLQVMLPVGENLSATPNLSASATRQLQKDSRQPGWQQSTNGQWDFLWYNYNMSAERGNKRQFNTLHVLGLDSCSCSWAWLVQEFRRGNRTGCQPSENDGATNRVKWSKVVSVFGAKSEGLDIVLSKRNYRIYFTRL